MKKTLALLGILALLTTLAFTLTACGNTETPASVADVQDMPVPAANSFDANRVIAVYTREDGSGTRDAFVSITGVGEDMYPEAIVQTETSAIRSGVESNPYAIGYVSLGSLNDSIKALNIDGVTPSAETVKDGSYPIQRPFLIVTNPEKDADPLVQDFIAFSLSAQGQELAGTSWISVDDNAADYTTPGNLSGTLKIGGSTSVEPLMSRLKEAYESFNLNVSIEISGGGSGTGISEATDGIIDIGMSSRGLKDNEKEALNEYTIALDGVAVIVNTANPVNNLTMEQIHSVFTGTSTTWSLIN